MLDEVINGTKRAVWRMPHGSFHALNSPTAPRGPLAVLSGSFNPIHDGHIELANAAELTTSCQTVFELSVSNVDKPATPRDEVLRRIGSIERPVAITRAATFVEKSGLFPGACFVVGMDTAVRIVDPRYYGGSEMQLRSSLADIQSAGCRFLVAGRLMQGKFQSLADGKISSEFPNLFAELTETAFRRDISSTELRNHSSPRSQS